jgi:hypothetical protein
VDEYAKENIVDTETGGLLKNPKKVRSVDFEKAENDALFDGYCCIVTSELDYDERQTRPVYGGLWRIEQSFCIMKSDLYARPVFLSKNDHIRAHFLIAFQKRRNKRGELVDTLAYSAEDEIALDYKAIQSLFSVNCFYIFLATGAVQSDVREYHFSTTVTIFYMAIQTAHNP